MPAAADPELALQLAKATLDVYAHATEQLLQIVAGRLTRGVDEPGWAERKLSEIVALRNQAQGVLDGLTTAGPDAVTAAVTAAFETGAADAAAEVTAISAGAPGIATNTQALDALIAETVTNITGTHGQILRSTLDAYRDVISHTSAPDVLTGARTTRQAAQQALDRFANKGITGFIDRAGKNWQLESYVEMATRTSVGRAQVAGALDRFTAADHDLVIVSDAPQECRLCRPWEGKVLSISGRTPGYKTVGEAQAAGLQHANCRHRLGAYIGGLTEPMHDTEDPEGDTARQEQRRLERGVRQWKRREAVALDDQAAAAARAKVRAWQAALKAHVDANDLKRLRYREQIGGNPPKRPVREPTPAPKPKPAAKPEPSKRGPAPGTVKPSAALNYATKNADRFRPFAEQVDQLHGLADNGMAKTEVVTGKATRKGGHFSPARRPTGKPKRARGEPYAEFAARMSAWRSLPLRPEIRVNDRGDGSEIVSFLHELGHRTDYIGGGQYATAGRSGDAIKDAALVEFLTAAKASTPIADAVKNFRDIGFVRYFRDPIEIWARAYSQWAANQLGGDARVSLDAMRTRSANYQWTDDEFATLAPLVENVLRSRGLML